MSRTVRDSLIILVLAAVYFAAAKFGLSLAVVHTSASVVWPPTGIALAAVLVLGHRVWPGILLGAFLANALTDGNLATAAAIGAGNTLEAVVGAWLVNRFAGGARFVERTATLLRFVLLAALLATMISATIGVVSLSIGGFARWERVPSIWLAWWLGDAVSALIVAPLLVILFAQPMTLPRPLQLAESALLLAVVVGIGATVFGGWSRWPFTAYPFGFLCIPPLVWAAYRFGLHGAVITALVMGCLAIWGTLKGFGPFASEDRHHALLMLQAFMGTVSMTSLLLASAVHEHRRAAAALSHSRDHLRELVAQRTADLEASLERLRFADRMATLGTLAAGIGHDIANLLVPIRARLELLERLDLHDEVKESLATIGISAGYFERLASGLRLLALDPARAAPRGPTELRRWWADVEPVMKNAVPRGVALQGDLPDEECRAAISQPALTQVIFNLVKNAGDAIGPGARGLVRVAVRRGGGDRVLMIVSDDGPGMTAEVKRRCVEPFFTTKPRGISTGLGLVLVYGLVKEAGGMIDLESQPGGGTTFTIMLDAARPDDEHARRAGHRGRAVVDLDDARLRSLVAMQVRLAGFDVAHAHAANPGDAALLIVEAARLPSALTVSGDAGPRIIVFGDPGTGWRDGIVVLPARPKTSDLRAVLGEIAPPA